MYTIKRLLIILVVLFALYYLWKAPTSAANSVRGAASVVGSFFNSMLVFFRSLFA